jgi:hypothetical protein
MSVNKDFVVKNGLEVNSLLIRTNTTNNRVGINTNIINATLDVNGGIITKNLSVSGISTFSNLDVINSLFLSGSQGTSGQYLRSTGTGVTWSNFPTARTSNITTAIVGQTLFNFIYTVGLLDVFVNGTKLAPSEFTASDGYNIILSTSCIGGETIELIAYSATTVGIVTTIVTNTPWVSVSSGIHTLSNVGIGTTNATDKLTVRSGDISVGINTSQGLILTSPNGTRYRLIVDNSGTLSTVAV